MKISTELSLHRLVQTKEDIANEIYTRIITKHINALKKFNR